MKDLLDLFQQLAEIDSVSGGEDDIAEFVERFLKNLGVKVDRDENDMLFVSSSTFNKSGTSGYSALFCSHFDTVEPGRGIRVIEEDGYLVSKGGTILGGDNKIALAAILHSFKQIITEKRPHNLELLFTVREETNSGIREFDHSKIKSTLGFIFDEGNGELDQVVLKAPYIYDFIIEAEGLGSHASSPESAKSVLPILVDLLTKLPLGRPFLDTTLNVGLIDAGDATNTVPSDTTLKGDLRSNSSSHFDKIMDQVEEVAEIVMESHKSEVELTWLPYADGYTIDDEDQDLQRLVKFYSKYDLKLDGIRTTAGSDAGFLNNHGIKTFCLSDGVENKHTTEERIKLETFTKLAEIVEGLMVNFASK
jgi:tripeptide aminopeptidase